MCHRCTVTRYEGSRTSPSPELMRPPQSRVKGIHIGFLVHPGRGSNQSDTLPPVEVVTYVLSPFPLSPSQPDDNQLVDPLPRQPSPTPSLVETMLPDSSTRAGRRFRPNTSPYRRVSWDRATSPA